MKSSIAYISIVIASWAGTVAYLLETSYYDIIVSAFLHKKKTRIQQGENVWDYMDGFSESKTKVRLHKTFSTEEVC